MKKYLLLLCVAFLCQYELIAQSESESEFELEPSQSMLMTGKGPGQDGAINPYYGKDCFAIVKNIGKSSFSIRIQQKGKIINTITIASKEVKKIKLLKEHELYLDANSKEKINAKVDFEKIDN
ncbi:hypothetical protein AB9K26_07040 [Psychroserpens sp. XS_ASV72]|uniref:hypothetical protein n=1 Tax=Psychroserpens sp. XS_ASV72 TaxID=3241293 RepID=UPI0035134DE4